MVGASSEPLGQLSPAVARAVGLLNALASGPASLSLASLSRHLGIPRSSTLAVCNTLVRTGLLVRGQDGTYRLGPHVLELSRAYLAKTDLHTEFERATRDLNVLPEQTLVLSVLDQHEVVYIGRRRGALPVGINYELGMRLPAHCTASGKAILSSLSTETVVDLYSSYERARQLPGLTPRSIRTVDALLVELQRARANGYAIDNEETSLGMMCVGAPIFDSADGAAGAVAVSTVKASMQKHSLESMAHSIQQVATRVSAALGGVPKLSRQSPLPQQQAARASSAMHQ